MASKSVSGDLKPGPGGSKHPSNSSEAGPKPPIESQSGNSSDPEVEPSSKRRAIDPKDLFQRFSSLENEADRQEFYKKHLRSLSFDISFPETIRIWLKAQDLRVRQQQASLMTAEFRERLNKMEDDNAGEFDPENTSEPRFRTAWDDSSETIETDPSDSSGPQPMESVEHTPPTAPITNEFNRTYYPRFIIIHPTEKGSGFKE